MIEQTILLRYLEGNATDEERESVVEWLESNEDNLQELIKLRKLHNISIFNEPMKGEEEGNPIFTKKFLYEFAKIAAVFLLFLVGNYFLNNRTETSTSQTLFVPSGQRAEIMLPDSSIVWINAKTRMCYASDFGKTNRIIELDGEAYFKVKKGQKHAFVVRTKEVDINVLGTEFNVIAYRDNSITEISLVSGSIELKGATVPNGTFIMEANNLVRISDGKFQSSIIENYDYFRWKEGVLCFDNESIETIFKKLELYYDINIKIEKKSLLKLRYSGKFRTKDGVEQVLKVLQLEHKFDYTVNSNLNLITIK